MEIIQYLIEQQNVNKEAADKQRRTALHYAIKSNRFDIIQYLIEQQNVNKEAKDKQGKTALHYAFKYGSLDIIKYLVEKQNIDITTVSAKEVSNISGAAQKIYYYEQTGDLNVIIDSPKNEHRQLFLYLANQNHTDQITQLQAENTNLKKQIKLIEDTMKQTTK